MRKEYGLAYSKIIPAGLGQLTEAAQIIFELAKKFPHSVACKHKATFNRLYEQLAVETYRLKADQEICYCRVMHWLTMADI